MKINPKPDIFWTHNVKKLLLTMKMSFLLLILSVLNVYATNIFSQNGTISVDMQNATIREVVREIERQGGINFLFNDNLAGLNQRVNVSFTDQPIKNVLAAALGQADLMYEEIKDDFVVLLPKPDNISQQQINITGRVTDAGNGEGLPGVSVFLQGTQIGTSTDVNGNYSINVPNQDAVLVFSFVGFTRFEIVVSDRTTIDVSLEPDLLALDEVVLVGYGQQRRINLTGALDVVTNEQIQQRAVTNVTEALQGVSPNLIITQTGWSAEPGGSPSLRIRGMGSLTGDDSPYVLVDGVPMNLNSINPNDIESITILKDAAASAIYGARAAYGVILITTKKGAMEDAIQLEYSNNYSFSSPLRLPHMPNTLKYMTAHNQANVNAFLAPTFSDFNFERVRQYMAGEITDETWLLEDGRDWAGNDIWNHAGNGNNDWLHILYRDITMRQKHDVSVSGGGQNSSYFVSTSFWDQPGELAFGDMFYKRYNITGNVSSKPTNWLTFDLNTKYIKDERQYVATMNQFSRNTAYHNFARTNPYRPKILPNGEYSNQSNILALESDAKENHFGSDFLLSLSTTIEPVKNWATRISYNYTESDLRVNQNAATVAGTFPDGSRNVQVFPISSYYTRFDNTNYSMFNIVSSYNRTFNEHYFSLLGGFENELNQFSRLWGRKNNILVPQVPSISTATGEHYLGDSKSHWATMGFFGRFNYNFQEKYLLEFNARYDGSSRFEKETRWGLFPSASIGYNISREAFWSSIEPYISSLRLRASWGSLGNQNVPNYLYLPTLGMGTNLWWIMGNQRPNFTTAPGIVSAGLTWETSTTTNAGIDIAFLEGRLSSSLDVYNRKTLNMFGPAEALPLVLGTAVPRANNATLETRGFELIVGWKDRVGAELSYNIRAHLADNITTVLEYYNPTKTLSTWYEGQRVGDIWGLTTVGLYQSDAEAANGPDQTLFWPSWSAGDIHYKDIDGDGKITRGDWTADSHGDYSIIGNTSPRYLVGFSGGLEWRGFDFNMFWQGVLKRDFPFHGNNMMYFGFNGQAWWDMNMWEQGSNTTLDYWRPANETNMLGPNTDAYYPKPYLSHEDMKNKQIQTRYTENAAYLRLKNINIGYTLPSRTINRIGISNARVFVSGENLITISPLTKLIDPENAIATGFGGQPAKMHPLRQVYALGLNVTF